MKVAGLLICALLGATRASAQAGEACGVGAELLFHCGMGEKQVAVCLDGRRVSYAFGADRAAPELELSSEADAVEKDVFDWSALPSVGASVTFGNGGTRYRVHVRSGAPATGGVDVIAPSGAVTALSCDAGSVWPRDVLAPGDPFAGLGRLSSATDSEFDPLAQCANRSPAAEACAGIVAGLCDRPDREARMDCHRAALRRWDGILEMALRDALALARDTPGEWAERIERGQALWSRSLAEDCALAGGTAFDVMDGELGELACLMQRAARRVDFLRAVARGIEFDG